MKILNEDIGLLQNIILLKDVDYDDSYFILITDKQDYEIKEILQNFQDKYSEEHDFQEIASLEDIKDALPGKVYEIDGYVEIM